MQRLRKETNPRNQPSKTDPQEVTTPATIKDNMVKIIENIIKIGVLLVQMIWVMSVGAIILLGPIVGAYRLVKWMME